MDKESQKPYKAYKVWIMAFHAALGSFIFSYNIGVFTSNQPCVAATLGWGGDKDVYIAVFSSFWVLFGLLGKGILKGTGGIHKVHTGKWDFKHKDIS